VYDAIIVGARCAGAATAMLLARRGFDVLLVDRARFPSDVPRGHFIHRHGPARLHAWGLLERVLATGCSPVTSFVEDLGDFTLRGDDLVVDGVPVGLAHGAQRSTQCSSMRPSKEALTCGRASPSTDSPSGTDESRGYAEAWT
jgi:2-polyprenyl-6-methoxyphenol hydroxylase-like FAD-dependent oxidoreductase